MQLGHISETRMAILSKHGLLCGDHMLSLDFCEHCVFGKQRRISFSMKVHLTKGIINYIYSNLWGSAQVTFKGGASYFLTFIDDFSRKVEFIF